MERTLSLDLNVDIEQANEDEDEETGTFVSAPDSIEDVDTEYNYPLVDPVGLEQDGMNEDTEVKDGDVPFTTDDGSEDEIQNTARQAEKLAAKLTPGSSIKDLDEAYLLYCEYARLLGFSVKKGTQSYFQKTDVVRMKLFLCSSEGHSENRASTYRYASYKKQNCRTDCRARLRVVRNFECPWVVSVFETQHNHALLGPDESYLLRSSRNLSLVKRSVLEQFNEAGIGVSKAFRFVEHAVGGPENIGYIKKDAYDHMDRLRKIGNIGNHDADTVLKYFQDKSGTEPNFFWRVHLDDEGRLMNLYYRDSRCADDYILFGDVVSVDTTFRTNKYNLICAPFVGMNHHRQTVMFGIGFLSDESSDSFEWLFRVFLESVGGKEPQIIFSDQDQAMKNGIDIVFNRTAHRLCQWHINQNAPAHFGKLKNVKAFKDMWYECMHGCEDEDQFEQLWNTMLDVFNLHSNKWFASMYSLRRRWADVFTNHRFSGGLHATSRSEGTNKVIKDYCAASSSLKEFILYFERITQNWRLTERAEDAICVRGIPGQRILGNRFLRQGAKIYTRNVYRIFENEAISSINVDVVEYPREVLGENSVFRMVTSGSHRTRTVTYNQLADEVKCSCAMLTTWGIFCKHIIKVFYLLNIPTLPSKYFLNRWKINARNYQVGLTNFMKKADGSIDDMLFVHTLTRKMYDKAMDLKDASKRKEAIIERFEAFLDEISDPIPKTTKKRNCDASRSKTEDGFLNPPDADHPWRPIKRTATIYEDKRKNKQSKKHKQTASTCP